MRVWGWATLSNRIVLFHERRFNRIEVLGSGVWVHDRRDLPLIELSAQVQPCVGKCQPRLNEKSSSEKSEKEIGGSPQACAYLFAAEHEPAASVPAHHCEEA